MTTETALSVNEKNALAMYERIIEGGLTTFQEVGGALAEVRDRKLYRESHGTFEEYCQDRWNLSRSRAYQYIEAARSMSNMLDTEHPVENARQASELAKVPEEVREEVWEATVERTGGKPTAAAVAETWAEVRDADDITEVEVIETERQRKMRRAKELREQGMSYAKIAKEIGSSPTTVHKWDRELDFQDPTTPQVEIPQVHFSGDTSPSEEPLEGEVVRQPPPKPKQTRFDEYLFRIADALYAQKQAWEELHREFEAGNEQITLSPKHIDEIGILLNKTRGGWVSDLTKFIAKLRKANKES